MIISTQSKKSVFVYNNLGISVLNVESTGVTVRTLGQPLFQHPASILEAIQRVFCLCSTEPDQLLPQQGSVEIPWSDIDGLRQPIVEYYTTTAVYLAMVGTLAFIWGYAYHVRRHAGM